MMHCALVLLLVLGPSLVASCGAYGEPCDEMDEDFRCCYSENACENKFCGGCKIGLQYACEDDLSSAPCCYECYYGHCAPILDQEQEIEEDEEEEEEKDGEEGENGGDGAVQPSVDPDNLTESELLATTGQSEVTTSSTTPSTTELTTRMIEASETIIRTYYVNGDKKIKKVISVQHNNGNLFEEQTLNSDQTLSSDQILNSNQDNQAGSMIVMDRVRQHSFRLVPVNSIPREEDPTETMAPSSNDFQIEAPTISETNVHHFQELRVVRDMSNGKILVLMPVQNSGSQFYEIKELKVDEE